MKRIVRDFVTLFNVLWYRDFPMVANGQLLGPANWTRHIGICVRSTADLMGYFTDFEAVNRIDAVIRDADRSPVAHIEWEWTQPFREKANELEKLRAACESVDFSVLVTYSRDENHEQNLERVREVWGDCNKPLILFLVRFAYSKGRHFSTLETYIVRGGIPGVIRAIRRQPAVPWKVIGTRWALQDTKETDFISEMP